jgi:hypothetical protein
MSRTTAIREAKPTEYSILEEVSTQIRALTTESINLLLGYVNSPFTVDLINEYDSLQICNMT